MVKPKTDEWGVRGAKWVEHDPRPLPEWVQGFRGAQVQAARDIAQHFTDGARVVFLDAPVGAGKTLIADMVRRRVNGRAVYVCSTKSLQAQMVRDFDYARELKGRANYTPQRQFGDITCADCDKTGQGEDAQCAWCPEVETCPYGVAKARALGSPIAVLNTAYFLNEANWQGGFSGADLVIVDESDLLERELLGFVSLEVPARMVRDLGLEVPKKGSHMPTLRAWLRKEFVPGAQGAARRLRGSGSIEDKRERGRLERMVGQVGRVLAREEGWVRDGAGEERARGGLVLKPVSVEDVARDVLWRHGARWLLMSGTTISAQMEAEALGLEGIAREDAETGEVIDPDIPWAEVNVPMTFPVENRPVYFCPVALNTYREQEGGARERIAEGVVRVLQRYPEDKVLVHTHSFAMSGIVEERVARARRDGEVEHDLFTYRGARDRDEALGKYRAAEGAAVLVGASLDRGIDLADDACFRLGTPILCQDMRWRPIESLAPGDQIIGVDEDLPGPQTYRRLRNSTVEAVMFREAMVYHVHTTHGDVYATANHPFLSMTPSSKRRARWRTLDQLAPGYRLWHVAEPVEQDRSWEAGYLAGFFDGEGCVDKSTKMKKYSRLEICGVQQAGVVLDRTLACLEHLGFRYRLCERDLSPRYTNTWEVKIAGRLSDRLRFLSTIYPERLVAKVDLDGLVGRDLFRARILSVEPVGVEPVCNLQTSTHTYIASGFVTHNCRVVVVCKIPYPSLGDSQVSARVNGRGGDLWMRVQVWRSLVQMTGRAVRSETDWADSWVLDAGFGGELKKGRGLVPEWWREGLEMVQVRELMEGE